VTENKTNVLPFRRRGLTVDGVRFDDGQEALKTLLGKIQEALEEMSREGFHHVKVEIQLVGRRTGGRP
jgi:hypothetical protein